MKLSATIVLAATLGASAHPSGHAHRNAHRAVANGGFVMNKKPVDSLSLPILPPIANSIVPGDKSDTPSLPGNLNLPSNIGTPSDNPPKSVESPSSVASPSSVESPTGSSLPSSGVAKPFCGGGSGGGGKTKRATEAQDNYVGNVGGAGSDYGCNMQEISPKDASLYKYTVKMTNAGGDNQQCKVWNKIGPKGGMNGSFKGNEVMTLELAPNAEKMVAFDENSQVGFSCHKDQVPLSPNGQMGSTWFEGDFGNDSNKKWSGFDVSSLVASQYDMAIPGMKACTKVEGQPDVCSIIYNGGLGKNAFVKGTAYENGLGGNLVPGRVAIDVVVDYKGQ